MEGVGKHSFAKSRCHPGGEMTKFKVDTALLSLSIPPDRSGKWSLWAQSQQCFKCPLMEICELRHSWTEVLVNTTFPTRLSVFDEKGSAVCSNGEYQFVERGVYNLTTSGNGSCSIINSTAPINSNLPILWAFLIYGFIAAVYYASNWLIKRRRVMPDDLEEPLENVPELSSETDAGQASSRRKPRLKFLDAFRGISIGIMVFVNYGGGLYWFFTHSAWNGLTLADLVFPWFMFIMGVSMALSFEGIAKKRPPLRQVYYKILRRTLILFCLGAFVVNHNYDLKTFRVPGVLQRFAISYFAVAGVRAFTAVPSSVIRSKQETGEGRLSKLLRPIREVSEYWVEWLLMSLLVAISLLLTFTLQEQGCPKGYLGPGGLGDGGKYGNCTGGASAIIDLWFFGAKHIYQNPTTKWLYNTQVPYDPEGLLGSIMSICIVFLGLQAGQILIVYESPRKRIQRFLLFALIYGLLAGVLCKFSQNGGWIPVNKNLWSFSFILSLASMANLLMIVLYFIIDIKCWWEGEPFYFVGMNSILVYVGHEVFDGYFPFSWSPIPQTHTAHLAINLWGTSLWFLIAYYLHRVRFYLSI